MTVTPKHFAQLLKDSTLDPAEEQLIIDTLPRLTMEQIQEFAKALVKDVKQKQRILEQALLKTEAITLRMEVELQKAGRKLIEEGPEGQANNDAPETDFKKI